MANVIPQWGGPVIAPAQVFTSIQKQVTNAASSAQTIKNNGLNAINVRLLVNLYQECKGVGQFINGYKNNTLLQTYADSIHPDVGYDIDVAIDTCIAAYQAYGTWFRANITNLSKDEIDGSGNIVPREIDAAGGLTVIDGIIATVE